MSNLAIIAKDSAALTPARSALANLLAQADQLRRETEPLYERLQRYDEIEARARIWNGSSCPITAVHLRSEDCRGESEDPMGVWLATVAP
jgi:hypothetical protein